MPTFEDVRTLTAELPDAEESTSYRTPAFKVGGRLFARLHEDGTTLVVKGELEDRLGLPQTNPEVFYNTPHYAQTDMLLVRLPKVNLADLERLLHNSYQRALAEIKKPK